MGTPSADAPIAPAAAAPSAVDDLARRADLLLEGAPSTISAELADLATRAIELETTELEPSPRRTYQYLARDYEPFCGRHGLDALASSSVASTSSTGSTPPSPARP